QDEARMSSAPVPGAAVTATTAVSAPGIAVPPPAAAAPALVRRRREPLAWTTVLTFTGAFLVIVASAIFAVATWDLFDVVFKLVFLGLLTAGFYVAGRLVRTRLGLAGGGVALTVVASAMLLFDGWIAIDGYGWTGVWPWVAWLAVCSAIYWYTETSMGGGFFGVTGAAAQVAWVWLLGDGLGWQDAPRAAAIAVVALVWAYAGRRVANKAPFISLASVLKFAAPATALVAAFLALGGVLIGPTGWTEIISALIVAVAGSAIIHIAGLPSALAVFGHLPAFIAIASAHGGPGPVHAVVLFALAAAYVVYEVYRGGWGHGVLALAAELGAWLTLAAHFDWASDVTLAVVAALALSWSVASWIIRAGAGPGARSDRAYPHSGAASLERITFYGGLALLAVCTIAAPAMREVIPLTGVDVAARDALLVLGLFVAWATLAVLHRLAPAAIVAFGVSFWAAAAWMAWLFPAWHSAYYAIALLVVAAAWLISHWHVARLTTLPAGLLAWMARGITAPILLIGFSAAVYYSRAATWEAALLLAATAAWWIYDALTDRRIPYGLAVSSALLVLGVAVAVSDLASSDSDAAWSGALAAMVLVALGAVLRRESAWAGPWTWGAAGAGIVASMVAIDDPGPLVVALALTAAACVLAAWTSGFTEGAIVGGVVAVGSLFALAACIDSSPWVLFALVALPSLGMLAPAVLLRSRDAASEHSRWADAGLATGFVGISVLVAVPILADGAFYPNADWIDLGQHGLAAALLVFGAYVIAAGSFKELEFGAYVGVGLILAAYLVERSALDVGTAEWVSTPIALYLVWIGQHLARTRNTTVPLAIDIGATAVGLGIPSLMASTLYAGAEPWTHLAWAVALALVAIGAGVALRVRAYFFGGVAALVFTAIVRSWIYLVSFWWLVLGLIGVTMLVVALTWERQHSLVAGARSRVRAVLSDWR
ncbi:MAG: SCO7613 C-terminal domain-containing membrane protein, partial [Coriobacteriia bacterium]